MLSGFLLFAARAEIPQLTGNFVDPAALKRLSLEELAQIEVITPSKEPVRAFDSASAVFVITGEDIRSSGATSIPEVLRLAPGVQVARIDSSHWSIGIRGFGTKLTRSVLVLIDGRTVFTPLFNGTYWEVQDTLLEDVDRIEVVRGPGATVWGPNAVNGVINIITKSAKETHGMFLSAGGGNEEQGFINARYGGGSKNFNYRFYGKGFNRGSQVHSDRGNYDDWRAVQGGFRFDWADTGKGGVTLQGDLYSVIAGERVQTGEYTAPFSRVIDDNEFLTGGNVLARWQHSLKEGNDIQVQAYYDRTNRHEANLGELRNTFDVDFLQRIRLPWRQKLTWGLGTRFEPVTNIQIVTGLTFLPAKRTDYLLTGFLQDEISLVNDRLTLTLGSKALHTNYLRGIGYEPSIRLAWTPNSSNTLWAAFTHALRTPSDVEGSFYLSGLVQVLPDGTPWMARFNANDRFAPEQMNGYELGYRRLLGKRLLVDTSTYFNHYHGLFDQEITGATYFETGAPGVTSPIPDHYLLPAQFGNGLLAYTKGVEIAPEWRPLEPWRLRGSYSYLHMNVYAAPNSTDIGTAPGIEGSSPGHQFSIQSELDVTKKLQVDLAYRYVSALPGQAVSSYSTGDARIGWRVAPGVELSMVGRNLLQPSHFETGGNPGPLVGIRRSGYAQITWRR